MKKTIFLLCCTIIMTAILFFSGAYLLDLVAMSDILNTENTIDLDGDGIPDVPDNPDLYIGIPGVSFFQPFAVNPSGEIINVLRTFRQDAGKPINILVLAGDESKNTDTIMIVHFDPKDSQINILSVPRDTYITLSGYKFHKINSVYATKNGAENLKALIYETLGQKVDYYVYLNLKTIREIVDLLGGVEYDVPCDMVYDDPDQNLHINLKKGARTLTGKQVEGLLRFRKPNKWTKEVSKYYDGSDLKRIERQHDFFNEMLKQKLNIKYAAKIGDVVNTVYDNLVTDLPLAEMLKLARGLPGVSSEKLQTATLPGYAKTIDGLSYYIHDSKQSRALAEALLGAGVGADADTSAGADTVAKP